MLVPEVLSINLFDYHDYNLINALEKEPGLPYYLPKHGQISYMTFKRPDTGYCRVGTCSSQALNSMRRLGPLQGSRSAPA